MYSIFTEETAVELNHTTLSVKTWIAFNDIIFAPAYTNLMTNMTQVTSANHINFYILKCGLWYTPFVLATIANASQRQNGAASNWHYIFQSNALSTIADWQFW